jgi:four helix bundle protein
MGYFRIEDLQADRTPCQLHLDVCDLTAQWPSSERDTLAAQVRYIFQQRAGQPCAKSTVTATCETRLNASTGLGRARGEALETVHHLYMARMKGYIDDHQYKTFDNAYHEAVRMLNGLERKLEQRLPQTPTADLTPNPEPRTLTSDASSPRTDAT